MKKLMDGQERSPEKQDNWRKKSLNSNPLEGYFSPLKHVPNDQVGPIPKLAKINDMTFSLLINNVLTIFHYQDEEERLAKKTSKTFITNTVSYIPLPQNIEWMMGYEDLLYLGGEQQILVLGVSARSETKEVWRISIKNIKTFSFLKFKSRTELIVLTLNRFLAFDICDGFKKTRELPLQIAESKGLDSIQGIQIVVESYDRFYFVGTSQETKATARQKLGKEVSRSDLTLNKKCEVLFIAEFKLGQSKVEGQIFIIDYIFESGLFKKSRVYQLGAETFIVSLHEEIIVIKRNFSKFMVWDNISVVSSQGTEKKGQLVLADKKIMMYRELGQIHAYELMFDFGKAKFEIPKIDSFRGNDSEEEVLYEALIFEYKPGILMEVLYYFKQAEIYVPNRRYMPNQESGPKEIIQMHLVCIQQTEPTEKLKQLFLANKATEEIEQFVRRFQIDKLRVEKSKWEVSDKTEKEIESLLMEIKDNEYIQRELTTILKAKPHDLNFLLIIENKQILRYQKMLAEQLLKARETPRTSVDTFIQEVLKNPESSGQEIETVFNLREMDEIKLTIQWLLESKMFEKKLKYSQNFLSFKEYDFIELGKLKAASLREEIKLLRCKGFEKRLIYFFNSFKYLVLDDFREILRFVVSDLNEEDFKEFFLHFSYILPRFEQQAGEDRCILWDDTFSSSKSKIHSKEVFRADILKEMEKVIATLPKNVSRISLESSIEAFDTIFLDFIQGDWFIKNSYKQHTILSKNIDELIAYFNQLKQYGVCNILVELMYEKIERGEYEEQKVKEVMSALRKAGLFDSEYTENVEARLEVYEWIVNLVSKNRKKFSDLELPARSSFIILREDAYFQLLFNHFQNHLLLQIRTIYDTYGPSFFMAHFQKYLYSPRARLPQLIDFLDCFDERSDHLRRDLFSCISKSLKLEDRANTERLIEKLLNHTILPGKKDHALGDRIDEDKITFGIVFIEFFQKFKIDLSYYQLIEQAKQPSIDGAPILLSFINSYASSYSPQPQEVEFHASPQNAADDKPFPVDLSKMVDFFSFLLYFRDVMGLQVTGKAMLERFFEGLIDNGRFDEVDAFNDAVYEFGKKFDDKVMIEQNEHYSLLYDFKNQENFNRILEDTVLSWISKQLQQIAAFDSVEDPRPSQTIEQADEEAKADEEAEAGAKAIKLQQLHKQFYSISTALLHLKKFVFNQRTERFGFYLNLLGGVKHFSPKALLKTIKKDIEDPDHFPCFPSFHFMMELLEDTKNDKLNLQKGEEFRHLMGRLEVIHKDYIRTFQEGQKGEDVVTGDFCRFNAELVIHLVHQKLFRAAAFSLFYLFNSTYYYRDTLFYFLAYCMPQQTSTKDLKDIIHDFMIVDDNKELELILNSFVERYQIQGFVGQTLAHNNAAEIFREILLNNQLDEAYFSLIRHTQLAVPDMEELCLSLNKYRDEQAYVQSLLVLYIRTVQKYGEKQFFPTFLLYKSKLSSLSKKSDRMDLIKDIFILMSQMRIDISESPNAKEIKQDLEVLNSAYERFMMVFEKGNKIKITMENMDTTAKRLHKYIRKNDQMMESITEGKSDLLKLPQTEIPHSPTTDAKGLGRGTGKAVVSDEVKKIMEEKRALRENEKRLQEIQEESEKLLQQEFRPMISEIKKKMEEKYQKSLLEKAKEDEEEANKKQQGRQSDPLAEALDQINEEEKEQIEENKSKYRSKLVEETYKMLDELKKRRDKIRQETIQTYATEEQPAKSAKGKQSRASGSGNNYLLPKADLKASYYLGDGPRKEVPQEQDDRMRASYMRGKESYLRGGRESFLKGTFLFSDKNSEFYVPRRELTRPRRITAEEIDLKNLKTSDYLDKLKERMAEEKEKEKQVSSDKVKNKQTFEQIKEAYVKLEPETKPYLEKLGLIKNSIKAASEIIRKVYETSKQISNFVDLAESLLESVELSSEVIESKAIKIYRQAVRINTQLPLKQIFPSQFFTTVHPMGLRDYYNVAYGLIKPNLIKLMESPDFTKSVNGLAVFIRYGFGSDNAFSSKVYEDYTRALLNNYSKNPSLSEAQFSQLIDRLRNNYGNMSADKRKLKFQQLIQEIESPEKKDELIKKMLANMKSKSSLASKDNLDEFKSVLVNISENIYR